MDKKYDAQDYGIGICGHGHYLPPKKLSNEYIEKQSGVPLGTIEEKTGIKNRFIAEENQLASDLSAEAVKRAIDSAKISSSDIGLIICATFTGDYIFPSLAIRIQKIIGAKNAGAFDVMANCTGFQVAMAMASDRMKCDSSIEYAVVVGTALQSRYMNWSDINSAMYFGDGSGAVILKKVRNEYGILSTHIISNGHAYDSARLRGGGVEFPLNSKNIDRGLQFIEINGYDVWKQVIKYQPQAIRESLLKIDMNIEDVDFFVFHQANLELIKYLMLRLKKDESKTYINVNKYGNTAEASMAIALSEALDKKLIKKNNILVLSGVGAGFIFGSTVIRWV